MIVEVIGHIEEKNWNKYLAFDSLDENKEVLKKYNELWGGIKNEIDTINDCKKCKFGKDFVKFKFDSDNNLPLNKSLNLHVLTTIVRSAFENEGKFYLQVYSDDCFYELRV